MFIIYKKREEELGVKMKKHALMTKTLVVLMMFLLLTSISAVRADDDGDDDDEDEIEEEHEPENDRDDDGTVWLQTDIMTAMLDPERPAFQYWYSADENGSLARFRVAYLMIVEFEDNNTDGVYQVNETISFAPLDAFDWSLQTGAVTNDAGMNSEVYASYTKGGLTGEDWDDDWFENWMPGYGDAEEDDDDDGLVLSEDGEDDEDEIDDDKLLNLTRFEGMTLQFYAHMYLNDYNGTVEDDEGVQANYTIDGGVELKVDIEIGNFPYLSNTSKVAVLNYLQEDIASSDDSNYHFTTHEDDGDNDYESEDEWESDDELGEKFEDKDDDHDDDHDVQELSLVDGSTNTTRGIYRWLDKAVITLPNGTETAVDVGASYWTDGTAMLLFLAYPNFDGGSILHDPSLKFIESASPVDPLFALGDIPIEISAIVVVGVVALVVIAMAIRRR